MASKRADWSFSGPRCIKFELLQHSAGAGCTSSICNRQPFLFHASRGGHHPNVLTERFVCISSLIRKKRNNITQDPGNIVSWVTGIPVPARCCRIETFLSYENTGYPRCWHTCRGGRAGVGVAATFRVGRHHHRGPLHEGRGLTHALTDTAPTDLTVAAALVRKAYSKRPSGGARACGRNR